MINAINTIAAMQNFSTGVTCKLLPIPGRENLPETYHKYTDLKWNPQTQRMAWRVFLGITNNTSPYGSTLTEFAFYCWWDHLMSNALFCLFPETSSPLENFPRVVTLRLASPTPDDAVEVGKEVWVLPSPLTQPVAWRGKKVFTGAEACVYDWAVATYPPNSSVSSSNFVTLPDLAEETASKTNYIGGLLQLPPPRPFDPSKDLPGEYVSPKSLKFSAPLMGFDGSTIAPATPLSDPVEVDTPEGNPVFLDILDEILRTHIAKNHDYSGKAETFGNIRAAKRFGIEPWVGAVLRLNDKVARIASFLEKGELKCESIEDSLLDIANYAIIALAVRREDATLSVLDELSSL